MTSVLIWLTRSLPNGLYATVGRSLLAWCDSKLSVNTYLKGYVRKRLNIAAAERTPAWFSEVYQLTWIVFEGVLLYLSYVLIPSVAPAVAILALYRCLEILLFATGWVFFHASRIHSYRRSLTGFLLNVGEVVICFAAAGLGFRCAPASSVWQAVYSSLRTTATIGPLSTMEPRSGGCFALMISQIGVSYFLAAVVLAGVVGSLRRREEHPR
jgi:hypothetical protein